MSKKDTNYKSFAGTTAADQDQVKQKISRSGVATVSSLDLINSTAGQRQLNALKSIGSKKLIEN
tara:strand:+ start:559 stop:750 length:192 start_codon:yes stop_codon:yes gene_type:complete